MHGNVVELIGMVTIYDGLRWRASALNGLAPETFLAIIYWSLRQRNS